MKTSIIFILIWFSLINHHAFSQTNSNETLTWLQNEGSELIGEYYAWKPSGRNRQGTIFTVWAKGKQEFLVTDTALVFKESFFLIGDSYVGKYVWTMNLKEFQRATVKGPIHDPTASDREPLIIIGFNEKIIKREFSGFMEDKSYRDSFSD